MVARAGRRRFATTSVVCFALAVLASIASGDTLILKDGRRVEGTVVRETATTITVETPTGKVEYARADVVDVKLGKTPREVFKEREAAAKTADDFYELGAWAETQKLKSFAKDAYKKAVALDPNHAGANTALGFVKYKDVWLTPDEKSKRAAADEEAEKLAAGFARYEGRWVTADEKSKLDQGLVLWSGRWMPKADALRAQGLEEFEGRWIPRAEALARRDVLAAQKACGEKLAVAWTEQLCVAGPWPEPFLTNIAAQLGRGRAKFDAAFGVEAGLALLGGRMAEFYCFARDDRPYVDSVVHFAALSPTLPPGWGEATARAHGFYWFDPYALSSARLGFRNEDELTGHCVHHWGHLLVNRDRYDGRLLPPWYDESLACWLEFEVLGTNVVACRSKREAVEGGTSSGKVASVVEFDWTNFRHGGWRAAVLGALDSSALPTLEKLSLCDSADLGLVELGTGMAILEWIESKGPGALGKFHGELRKGQPRSPERVERDVKKRLATYDAALRAATGEGLVAANKAWKDWFRSRR
ncbi:MAG: tetratricopeptide repeat protein [Planctomycetes bacterium]|nr:tetratricopeptide repeat protein [Planctomycetota bacterium]